MLSTTKKPSDSLFTLTQSVTCVINETLIVICCVIGLSELVLKAHDRSFYVLPCINKCVCVCVCVNAMLMSVYYMVNLYLLMYDV